MLENGADRLVQHRVAIDLLYVRNAVYAKCDKPKHIKMR